MYTYIYIHTIYISLSLSIYIYTYQPVMFFRSASWSFLASERWQKNFCGVRKVEAKFPDAAWQLSAAMSAMCRGCGSPIIMSRQAIFDGGIPGHPNSPTSRVGVFAWIGTSESSIFYTGVIYMDANIIHLCILYTYVHCPFIYMYSA